MSRSPFALALPAALAFCSFALWNGFPVLYYDSIAYLQRPADVLAEFGLHTEWTSPPEIVQTSSGASATDPNGSAWSAGRSVYYGLFALFFSALAGPGAIVFAQAYLLSATLAIAWMRGFGGTAVGYAVVVCALALASTASAFAAILMPDLLAGIALLAAAAGLAWWDKLQRLERLFLVGICGFAAVSHDSLLAILLAACGLAGTLWLICRRGGRRPPFRLVATTPLLAGAAAGIAGGVLFHFVALASTGEPPTRLPFLSARLATTDLGREHLARTCPESGYALCRYQDRLDGTWIEFMFSTDPAVGVMKSATLEDRRAITREQVAFTTGVVAAEPLAAAALYIGGAFQQVGMMSLRDFEASDTATGLLRSLGPSISEPLAKSRLFRDPRALDRASDVYVSVATLSAVIAIAWVVIAGVRRRIDRTTAFVAALLAGAALNAIVCGVLASPYDRFQARVAWLLPLAATVVLLHAYGLRGGLAQRRPASLASAENT